MAALAFACCGHHPPDLSGRHISIALRLPARDSQALTTLLACLHTGSCEHFMLFVAHRPFRPTIW